MKLLVAGLFNESNTFSPIPAGRKAFEAYMVTRTPTAEPSVHFTAPLHIWRKRGEALGWEVVDSLAAWAQPAGRVVRATYETYRDIILEDITRERPDVVMLSMHGAMAADGYDDCEGDLMTRARKILGPKAFIALEIDPHCHLTQAKLDAANVIVCYKEYPHTDVPERAEDLFDLTADAVAGRTNPVMRMFDCRMVSLYPTQDEPVRGFVDEMFASEGKDGILSLSLAHGFPYGDTAATGTRMLAIANGDPAKAETTAQAFGEKFQSLREQMRVDWPKIDEALDRAEAATAFPVVLADTADNAGGGAPADSTFLLREILQRGLQNVAMGIFWDPILVNMACDAGIGATVDVRFGGKMGPTSGDPLDLTVTVRGIRGEMQQLFGVVPVPIGTCVWLETQGVNLIVNDMRTQCLTPQVFADLGLDPSTMKFLVPKSLNHFYAAFAPIASQVIHIATPGALSSDYTSIPYAVRELDYWPRVELA